MLYNTKNFVVKILYILLAVFAVLSAFFYYNHIQHKKQVREIVLMKQFLLEGKTIDIANLQSTNIKNKNILASLVVARFQTIKNPSEQQLSQYFAAINTLNPETNIKASALYSFGIAYLELKNYEQVLLSRQNLQLLYNKTKNDFVLNLQKHYDVNILSSLSNFNSNFNAEQSQNLIAAINKMPYFANLNFTPPSASSTVKYDNDILSLYR